MGHKRHVVKSKNGWTKDDCEKRYLCGEPITLEELAKESGFSRRTLETYSAERQWYSRREMLNRDAIRLAGEKVINKISDNLSDVAKEHFEGAKVYRNLAILYAKSQTNKIKKASEIGEAALLVAIEAIDDKKLLNWAKIFETAIRCEAAATGIAFEINPNAAISSLQKLGYGIREQSYLDEIEQL